MLVFEAVLVLIILDKMSLSLYRQATGYANILHAIDVLTIWF